MASWSFGYLFAAKFGVLAMLLKPGDCQVYSWTKQPGDIYNQPCNSDQLKFTWTYTPASPDPALIEWSKEEAGAFQAIATFAGGTFTPVTSYTGRVEKLNDTAELGLKNPTASDDGEYRVSVTDASGMTLISDTVHVLSVSTAILDTSGISATCTDGKTVMCAGVLSIGEPGANLTLSYGSFSKDNEGLKTTVSEMTSLETVTCSISGPATECLGQGEKKSASVECGHTSQSTDSSTSQTSSETSSSPTSVENTTAPPTSDTSSSTTSVENETTSPFACQSNCVEESRRIYLSVFLPVLILVAIDVVVIVSVVGGRTK